MSKEPCKICHGSGTGTGAINGDTGLEIWEGSCTACSGTGFESHVPAQKNINAPAALEKAVEAFDEELRRQAVRDAKRWRYTEIATLWEQWANGDISWQDFRDTSDDMILSSVKSLRRIRERRETVNANDA